MRIIRESAQSLTHLRFHLERTHRLLHEYLGDHDEWIPTDAIGLVAEHLTGLKILSYIQVPSHKWRYHCDASNLPQALSKFNCLETFWVNCLTTDNFRPSGISPEHVAQGSLKVAEQSMLACDSSLRRVGFPVWDTVAQVAQNTFRLR